MPPKSEKEKELAKSQEDEEKEKVGGKMAEEPPPAWHMEKERVPLTIKYWKTQMTSAKREVTRRRNQVKKLRSAGSISQADLRKLAR